MTEGLFKPQWNIFAGIWIKQVSILLFNSRSLISCSLLSLLDISHTDFQNQIFWLLIFPMWDPKTGKCERRFRALCPQGSLPYMDQVQGMDVQARLRLLPPTYLSVVFLLSLVVKILFLLVLRSLSEIVFLHVVAILVYPREEGEPWDLHSFPTYGFYYPQHPSLSFPEDGIQDEGVSHLSSYLVFLGPFYV